MYYHCPNCDKKAKTPKELRELGCNCTSQPLKMLEADEINKTRNKAKEEDDRSTAKKVYDFAMSKIKKLIISENNSDEVYAIIESNGHVESLNLDSKRTRQWIYDQYTRNVESNDIHGDDFFKTVTDAIIAKAQMNGTERARVYNRISQTENQILYDLGTPDWKIIKITPGKVETVSFDETLPIFQRRQSLHAQIIPQEGHGAELEKLAELLHIIEEDRQVFIVHVVCMFLESCSIPMMVFDGSAGSFKTTATATIKRIVDPSGKQVIDNVSAMAEKQDDLIIQLNNRYMSSFDNVSRIYQSTSDVLCRAITGSGNMRRKKYTDESEVIHNFKRKMVVNGVVPTLDYPDLQTRILIYPRKFIDDGNRITEQEFNERLESLLPGLLAKIFTTLSNALKTHSETSVKIRPKTRMADFETWGEAISQVLGFSANSFLNSYHRKVNEGQISQIDTHPVVESIQTFMNDKENYENTTSHLYHELVNIATNSGIDLGSKYIRFPKTPNYLPKELKIVDPLIRAIGFIIETYHYTKNDGRFGKNASIVRITRKKTQSTLDVPQMPSLPSPSSPEANLGTKTGEDTGEATGPNTKMSSPITAEFTHKSSTGEGSEDGEDIPGTLSRRQLFYCKTHKAGPWPVGAPGSAGMKVIDHHKGCNIVFTTEGEGVKF